MTLLLCQRKGAVSGGAPQTAGLLLECLVAMPADHASLSCTALCGHAMRLSLVLAAATAAAAAAEQCF